jgi:SAM-dependent methyltransferase
MDVKKSNLDYLLDSDDELLRLERQAKIYGFQDDLRHLALSGAERVLDAGCGAGVITRAVARALPQGNVIGVDRETRYVDFARCKAASEQLSNIEFQVADVLSLPFSGGTFDVLWSKHLLQWVKERDAAVREFKRVVRPGGRVVCCNFDGLWANPYPADSVLQRDLDLWFAAMEAEVGYDRFLGRKLASMLSSVGLVDVCVDFIPDRAYGGFGGDLEKRWNWERQWASAVQFSARVYGSVERAKNVGQRLMGEFSRPDVHWFCPLFYVEGRVPE